MILFIFIVIIGPVVASLFITLLDIYSTEFKRQIRRQKSSAQIPDAALPPAE